MSMCGARRKYLVDSQRKRVNVALFRGGAAPEVELRWIEQFRSHVADTKVRPRPFRFYFRLHGAGIGCDSHDPEVPQTRRTILIN